jgi:hypothetical protein
VQASSKTGERSKATRRSRRLRRRNLGSEEEQEPETFELDITEGQRSSIEDMEEELEHNKKHELQAPDSVERMDDEGENETRDREHGSEQVMEDMAEEYEEMEEGLMRNERGGPDEEEEWRGGRHQTCDQH